MVYPRILPKDIASVINCLKARMSENEEASIVKRLLENQPAQLKTPESWGIQSIKLRLGEISTSASIAKHCGSIFSRRENSSLLDAVAAGFNIHIQGLPLWLRDIQLTRSVTILGAHMRRIKVPKTMEELDMFKLSGLATFVVLCCRYSEDEDIMIKMLDLLIVGELGTVVKIDKDRHPIPYTFKGHIGAFVKSCLDADRDSDVSKRANRWMAELHAFGELNSHSKEFFLRRGQASLDLIGELLGAAGVEKDMAKRAGELFQQPAEDEYAGGWAKIYHTLHLTSAYIALAAAAHGACVVVQCISDKGSKIFPKEPNLDVRRSTFLVCLWLTQPPEHICGILRHSNHSTTSESDTRNLDNMRDAVDENVTVVGGALELATWVSRKLRFRCQLTEKAEPEALLDLWRRGAEYSKKFRWVVKKRLSTINFGALVLVLKSLDDRPNLPAEALPLSKALLNRDKRVRPLTRPVANIVHDFYRLDDYSLLLRDDDNDDESEIFKAMQFVIISISVEILRNTIHSASDTTDTYALNLATLNPGTRAMGNLHDLIRSALNLNEGVAPFRLVTTAATVWGGAQFSSTSRPGYQKPVDHLLGVVTPQCTVIFDFLRDPLPLVREGRTDQLLSIWRGPVPMLPRDPVTNCIYSGYDERWIRSEVWPEYAPKTRSSGDQVKGHMLWTFEPFDHEATRGVFCFWYNGNLVAEFAPHSLITAILSGSRDAMEEFPSENAIQTKGRSPETFVELSKSDLLEMTGFTVKGKIGVIIKGLDDLVWSMFALGCAAGTSESSHHLLTFTYRGDPDNFDVEDFRKKMTEGQVIVLVP
jgi:hypothetical protein